jgi:hypothetical protein
MEFPESVALEGQETVHVPDIAKVLLPSGFGADAFLPAVDQLQYSGHDGTREGWRSLRKAANKLVEEFLGGYLQMEWISA